MKHKITKTPLLALFDPDKKLVLQVYSSNDGLDAALLQDGKPIEHACIESNINCRKKLAANREDIGMLNGTDQYEALLE